jgi:hypothetical protein
MLPLILHEIEKKDDDKISGYFVPSNSSSVSEPMDERVIESMKGIYHNTFIQKLTWIMKWM